MKTVISSSLRKQLRLMVISDERQSMSSKYSKQSFYKYYYVYLNISIKCPQSFNKVNTSLPWQKNYKYHKKKRNSKPGSPLMVFRVYMFYHLSK